MYSFLRGEMYRQNITIKSLAEQIGISEKSLRNKLNGETDFTWPEAQAIRNIIDRGASVEVLFRKDEERQLA